MTSGKVATDSLDATDLAADSVAASEIAAGAVGTSEVADDTLTATDLAADSVASSELADNAVDTAAIQADAVTSAKIPAGGIAASDIRPSGIASTVSINPPSIAADTCTVVDTAVASIASGDIVILNTPAALESGLLADAANQDAAGQLRVRFCNTTTLASINGGSQTYNFLVIR